MSKYKVTMTEYLKGRDQIAPLTYEMYDNMCKLLVAVNMLRDRYGKPLSISSGYRPPEINKKMGGSPNSAHLTCEAVDIADGTKALKRWIAENPGILDELDLYMEEPASTPTWVHLDIRKRPTRIFKP